MPSPPPDPLADLEAVRAATERLLRTVEAMDPAQRSLPSLCADWSRADVVAHLTRNADSLLNLLVWARTGEETPGYASAEARAEGIRTSAALSAEQAALELREASVRLQSAGETLPTEAWDAPVVLVVAGSGRETVARAVPWQRHKEVEIHHVDLDLDYTPAHWPADFTERMLEEAVTSMSARPGVAGFTVRSSDTGEEARVGGGSTLVSGPSAALVAWLLGRSSGDGLHVEGGDLPALPAWG